MTEKKDTPSVNNSIQTRLSGVMLMVLVFALGINFFIFSQIQNAVTRIDAVFSSNVDVNELSEALELVENTVYEYLNTKSTETLENYYRYDQNYKNLIEDLNDKNMDSEVKMLEKNIRRMSESYLDQTNETVQAKRGRNVEKYKTSYETENQLYEYINTYIYKLNNLRFKTNSANYQLLLSSMNVLYRLCLIVLIVVYVVGPMNEWDYADGWVLKGDFSKFFYTLLHSYCYETARRALKWLKDPELIDFAEWLLWLIIDSTPDPGIPIGNQSSQLLALLYLDAFDHWLRDDRGLVYGRYMDDFYIIHSDKLLLRQILKEIEAYIKPLGLRLNGKTQILPLKNGIDFLGFHTYLTQTGKVVRKVRAKSIDNMKRKIRKFRGLVDSGKMTLDSVVQSYASWTGHISHGNTYHLRQNMDAYFFSYFPELKPSPKGDTTHGPKTEQPRKQVEGQVRQPVRQPDRLDRGR